MMDPGQKPRKPKFKYTRQLIRLAVDDGMTQKEIAALCRVEQSVVSGWLNGKSLAFEHQVAELKRRYGRLLNRTTSRVYLVHREPAEPDRWEHTSRAQRLMRLKEAEEMRLKEARTRPPRRDGGAEDAPDASELDELRNEIAGGVPGVDHCGVEWLIKIDQIEYAARHAPPAVTLIEGPITLRHTFVRLETARRGSEHEPARVPIARWLVHHQAHRPPGRFVLVRQRRRMLVGLRSHRWEEELRRVSSSRPTRFLPDDHPVECADDAGRWLSFVEGPFDAAGLLAYCDRYLGDRSTLHGPHDELALPFLVRKMLVELGCLRPGLRSRTPPDARAAASPRQKPRERVTR